MKPADYPGSGLIDYWPEGSGPGPLAFGSGKGRPGNGPVGSHTRLATTLPVRLGHAEAVSSALARGRKAAVVVLKVGGLAQINHWNGYEVGDQVIEAVVHRIETCCQGCRLIGRLGGGHFLVIIECRDDGDSLAREIRHLLARVSASLELPSGAHFINCTAGVSLLPDQGRSGDRLLRNAELALQSARVGCHAWYTPELDVNLASEVEVRSALVGALEREEFFLVYQPQVCTITEKVFGVEALLRWQSPTLGLVPPDRFIPVAESAGLMPELGDWVLSQACCQASRWSRAGRPLRVAVNISALQLEEAGFEARVREILAECELQPSLLEIEVTESMLVGLIEDNQNTLQSLRELGVTLALDDFGTGYSNLAYLRNFVFDTLKIDRLFTSAITRENAGDVLVRAIIAMGAELGQEILAEGVETLEEKQVLQKLGCSRMQGYLFGRPVPASELEHG